MHSTHKISSRGYDEIDLLLKMLASSWSQALSSGPFQAKGGFPGNMETPLHAYAPEWYPNK